MTDKLKELLFTDTYGPIIADYLMEEYTSKHLILFADTCKTLRKYKFIDRMKLNKHFSNLYYYDSVFRKQVIDHMAKIEKNYMNNNEKLLILDLYRNLDIQIVDNVFDNLYSVNLSYSINITNPSALKNVKSVNLSYCIGLEDVSELCNVTFLNLEGCRDCVGINKLTNVHDLNISYCKNFTCDDLQYLINVDTLKLSGCKQITTLTVLPPKIMRLYFSNSVINSINNIVCDTQLIVITLSSSKITDINNLHNVEYLDLTHCTDLINISLLTNITSLSLSYCNNITDFKYIKDMLKLRRLNVSMCKQIKNTDLPYFAHVRSLDLAGCYHITDVTVLCNVYNVNLNGCNKLKDVSPLAKVKIVNLSNCTMLTDVSALSNVYDLNLNNCFYITDVRALGNIYKLNLSYCSGIKDVSALGNINTLNLSCCGGISDVSALGNVYNLNLSGCSGLKDVSALGNNYILDLSSCYGITDVGSLGNVYDLKLCCCYGITVVGSLSILPKGKLISSILDFESKDSKLEGSLGDTLCVSPNLAEEKVLTFSPGSLHSKAVQGSSSSKACGGSLGNNYILNLSGCTNIKDVSTLGNVHNLNLSECDGITDVSMLYNVCYLNVDDCPGITDTIALSKSKEYTYPEEYY